MVERIFTLDEARALLPELRNVFKEANEDLDSLLTNVHEANDFYDEVEKRMNHSKPDLSNASEIAEFRQCRSEFQKAIEDISREQNIFVDRLTSWIEKFSTQGVIVRSLKDGLVDFPAEHEGFSYLLCWRIDEDDITHWHLTTDGFIGRKPLVTLSEYF